MEFAGKRTIVKVVARPTLHGSKRIKHMRGLSVLFAMSIGGGVGWWLGSLIGTMTAVLLSGIGTGVGVYLMRKIIKNAIG